MRDAGLRRKRRLVKNVDSIVQGMRIGVVPTPVVHIATWVLGDGAYTPERYCGAGCGPTYFTTLFLVFHCLSRRFTGQAS